MIWLIIIVAVVITVGLAAFVGAPYVPSHGLQVRRAFTDLRPLTLDDIVVDLGSGDGVVLRRAIDLGAGHAIGYEINPVLVWLSRILSGRYDRKIIINTANMWRSQPPEGITVVYVFGVGRDMRRLVKLLQRWANTADKTIECVVYGHELSGYTPTRHVGAHHLYIFTPLQSRQAQV